jgi:hypothetical protein
MIMPMSTMITDMHHVDNDDDDGGGGVGWKVNYSWVNWGMFCNEFGMGPVI